MRRRPGDVPYPWPGVAGTTKVGEECQEIMDHVAEQYQ